MSASAGAKSTPQDGSVRDSGLFRWDAQMQNSAPFIAFLDHTEEIPQFFVLFRWKLQLFKTQFAFCGHLAILHGGRNLIAGIGKSGLAPIWGLFHGIAFREFQGKFIILRKWVRESNWVSAHLAQKHVLLQSRKEKSRHHHTLAGNGCKAGNLNLETSSQRIIC